MESAQHAELLVLILGVVILFGAAYVTLAVFVILLTWFNHE